jgi:outer membrane cobalamin receptor
MNLHTGTPVPFTARHMVSVNADVDYAGWSLDALWQMRSGRSDGYVDLPAWNTLDAALSKNFSLGKSHVLVLKIMVKNILDCRYETVSGYPMPGRSFMGGVEYKF